MLTGRAERLLASRRRLSRADYRPERVLSAGATGEWPADYPGRYLLAATAMLRSGGAELPHLEGLIAGLPAALNSDGYFGPQITDCIDEQQVAGHSWLVSGLLDYAALTGEQDWAERAYVMAQAVLLPAARAAHRYPQRRAGDGRIGKPSGRIAERRNGWRLSTDRYCVLIALEGLVAVHAARPEPAIIEGIEALLSLALRDDLAECRAQLHATLTAGRCAAVYYSRTRCPAALKVAQRCYASYRRLARTPVDAPWNWFGRPDSWTEPCAMVDALLLAHTLAELFDDAVLRAEAISIERNALAHAQRTDGSFGLDSVVTPRQPFLYCVELDAAWCCTMRGGYGLATLESLWPAELSWPDLADFEAATIVAVPVAANQYRLLRHGFVLGAIATEADLMPIAGDLGPEANESPAMTDARTRVIFPGNAPVA